MPLDNEAVKGTEKDGTKNNEYCKYCYQNGRFTSPEMTMEDMKKIVVTEMEKLKIPQETINMALGVLPHLKRWSKQAAPKV
jgi:hypothetical protein